MRGVGGGGVRCPLAAKRVHALGRACTHACENTAATRCAARLPAPPPEQGAATDARVYLEMYAPHEEGVTTGELRMLDIDTHAKPFHRDGVDLFVVGRGRGLGSRGVLVRLDTMCGCWPCACARGRGGGRHGEKGHPATRC